jgi:acetoin utilization protein AcuB
MTGAHQIQTACRLSAGIALASKYSMSTAHEPRTGARVRDYMTRAPRTIRPRQTLAEAHRLMRRNQIRHLPVLDRGKLVGIVSQRDLALIESLPDVDPGEVPVEDAMIGEVYVVAPGAPLGDVAGEMARRKLGAAVVAVGSRVVGVFTATDACRALSRVMAAHPPRRRASAAGAS